MKRLLKYIPMVVFLFFVACSPQKNTWLSRNYQSFATKYNVRFNAKTNFEQGVKSLIEANKDDYSKLLPMYPLVSEQTAGSISSQMNTTIEKCRKAIKLHSIRTKPSSKPIGMSKAEYRLFRQQEEFNRYVPLAWLMLGKAEYYKADFIGAVSSLNYATKHYNENTDLVVEATLWKVRSYTDMGWLNEAESLLKTIKEDKVPNSKRGIYSAFKAHLLVNQKRYEEAIPFIKQAIEKINNSYEKARFNFVLAQIYEMFEQKASAKRHYLAAKHYATNYEMIFNSLLKATILDNNTKKSIKVLSKMAKSSNNKDYLDQIYYAIGEKYDQIQDSTKALDNYKLAMAKSTRNGVEKALVALKIAKRYYKSKDYIKSLAYYDSTILAMPNEHQEYKTAEKKSQVLGELATNYNTVVLQDSLLRLSDMSEAEQLKVVEEIIERLKVQERQAAKDSANKRALAVAEENSNYDNYSQPMGNPIGTPEWYFYNSVAIKQGKIEFKKKWGNRPLEDNWNRKFKSFVLSQTNDNSLTPDSLNSENTSLTDSLTIDPHKPEYYLIQIPKSDKDRQKALEQIATALYNMGNIFYQKMEDFTSAEETYATLKLRFPQDNRIVETYFNIFKFNGKLGQKDKQKEFRNKIINEYPTSKYATMLSNPNYAENVHKMLLVQDSLYNITYHAYQKADYKRVAQIYQTVSTNYPMSDLLPKFTFLNALSIAKNGQKAIFESELDSIVAKYPKSEVTPVCKDILALIRQGREQSTTTDTTTLTNIRTTQTKIDVADIVEKNKAFSIDVAEPHNIIFVPKKNTKIDVNKLLYDVAAYNFTKFMVKNFDLELRNIGSTKMLVITGFDSLEESLWYKKLLYTDNSFNLSALNNDLILVLISNSNIHKISTLKDLEKYISIVKQ